MPRLFQGFGLLGFYLMLRHFLFIFPCSEPISEGDDAKLQEELAEGYLRFLQAKDENQRTEGTRLAKRNKKAKVCRRTP